jgi:predicted DNA-binding ribbon-helix-helix protein
VNLHPKGKSLVTKRTVVVGTRKTVEAPFWEALKEIAAAENLSLKELVTRINRDRQKPNLSSAIRLYVLDHYRQLASAAPRNRKTKRS